MRLQVFRLKRSFVRLKSSTTQKFSRETYCTSRITLITLKTNRIFTQKGRNFPRLHLFWCLWPFFSTPGNKSTSILLSFYETYSDFIRHSVLEKNYVVEINKGFKFNGKSKILFCHGQLFYRLKHSKLH